MRKGNHTNSTWSLFRFDFAQQIGFSVILMLNRCVLLYIEQVIIQCLYMHIETIQFSISCQRCSTRSILFFAIHYLYMHSDNTLQLHDQYIVFWYFLSYFGKRNNRNSSTHILCKIRQVTGRKFFFIPTICIL